MMVRQHTQHLTDQWRSSKQAVVDAVIAFAATLQPSPKPGAPQRGRNERIIRGSLQLSSHKGTLWTWNTPGPWTKSKLTYNGFYLIKYAAVKIWENVDICIKVNPKACGISTGTCLSWYFHVHPLICPTLHAYLCFFLNFWGENFWKAISLFGIATWIAEIWFVYMLLRGHIFPHGWFNHFWKIGGRMTEPFDSGTSHTRFWAAPNNMDHTSDIKGSFTWTTIIPWTTHGQEVRQSY